ncbi:uncharacterized protein KY384_000279 [Bacidia gigantensis]|uniref:uncharacterized protein n=1 Tax=Bacidia gigantensis TaxID=2732470 RepID=UPI001D045C17|nr:uncharacterized protein KY384_000279 [Bacidia gigantensis]KAG8526286.1 hypothetical protein KY384_000279 [Bacidia gigantensis]
MTASGTDPRLEGLFASLNQSSKSSPQQAAAGLTQQRNARAFDGAAPSRSSNQAHANSHADAQSNLLGLLNFGGSATPTQRSSQQAATADATRPPHTSTSTHSVHGRGISASDLVASIRGGGSGSGSKPPTPAQSMPRSSSQSHQESLLRLLNQTAVNAEEQRRSTPTLKERSPARDTPSPAHNSPSVRVFGSKENTPTPFHPESLAKSPSAATNAPMFTYVNPFEQLADSSPLNTQSRQKSNGISQKRQAKSPSPVAAQRPAHKKLTTTGNEVMQSIESPQPERAKDGRTQVEALMDIGAPSKDVETVAEALNEVGDQVHKQMEHALAEAEKKEPQTKEELPKDTLNDSNTAATNDGKLNNGDNSSPPTWVHRDVPSYQFPMKPFVSIEIVKKSVGLSVNGESIVNIARFKKEFDQIDRTLAAATRDFIVYGMPRNGGIRVIHQDNGLSRMLFPNTQDRVFNVVVSTVYDGPGYQRVIATGISGTVYWATIGEPGKDLSLADMESGAVIFPPSAAGSESATSGQLKTRAKKSSRHPEFFGIGRGKSIQIVFPSHARDSAFFGDSSTIDTEKYFADRSLKVTTGKAGKDFAFSEDDTTIATLDKAGKLRVWDISELVDPNNSYAGKLAGIEVKTPLLTYSTTHSAEKSWPTSVHFVDKIRAYIKGIAQRFIIVGMKQNHILQLWDLCLGKAVQELSFPHSNEADAICSVVYHPNSGIIAVGHPTRNSIYLIHLSSPRYNLPPMSQAKFVQRLATKDSTLPRAEATAIMSGLREYSLADIGQLRSLEITPPAVDAAKRAEDEGDSQLFELYVMHSKGVTCLGFEKEDLGWSADSKALLPVDAEQEGFIKVKDLREPLGSSLDSSYSHGDSASSMKTGPKSTLKETEKLSKTTPTGSSKTSEKSEKKKAKQASTAESNIKPVVVEPTSEEHRAPSPPPKALVIRQQEEEKQASHDAGDVSVAPILDRQTKTSSDIEPISLGISSELLDKEMRKIELGVSAEFDKSFQRELDALHRRLDNDRQVQTAAAGANQEAILRLVSKQLGDNVEKSLTTIVTRAIKDSVIPSISTLTANNIEKNIPSVIDQKLRHVLPSVLSSVVPEALTRMVQSDAHYRAVSEQITRNVTGIVEKEFMGTLQRSVIPSFQNLAVNAAQKIGQDTENRVRSQLQQAEVQRREDAGKIDQLANSVRVLSETIHQMAEAQSDFQSEILRLGQKSLQDGMALVRRDSPTPSESASLRVTPEQQEAEAVASAMQKGNYEEATIMWLQSSQQTALFDQTFVSYNAGYLRRISPLVVLSVGAAVTSSFTTSLKERLAWVDVVLSCLDPHQPEIQQVLRKVLDVISQRLQTAYIEIAEEQPNNTSLRLIAKLTRQSRELMNLTPLPAE